MKLKKRSRKKIREVQNMIEGLPMTSEILTYVKIYQLLQELYFQGKYKLVDSMCEVLLNE